MYLYSLLYCFEQNQTAAVLKFGAQLQAICLFLDYFGLGILKILKPSVFEKWMVREIPSRNELFEGVRFLINVKTSVQTCIFKWSMNLGSR